MKAERAAHFAFAAAELSLFLGVLCIAAVVGSWRLVRRLLRRLRLLSGREHGHGHGHGKQLPLPLSGAERARMGRELRLEMVRMGWHVPPAEDGQGGTGSPDSLPRTRAAGGPATAPRGPADCAPTGQAGANAGEAGEGGSPGGAAGVAAAVAAGLRQMGCTKRLAQELAAAGVARLQAENKPATLEAAMRAALAELAEQKRNRRQ